MRAFGVKALALAVTLMASGAAHAEDVPDPNAEKWSFEESDPAPAAALPVRKADKPLAMAPESSAGVAGTIGKLCAVSLVGLGAYVFMKRRRKLTTKDVKRLRVVERASIGVRTEIVLCEVEGERLLLGVTPNAIRTLVVLPQEPVLANEADEREDNPLLEETLSPAREAREELFQPATRKSPASDISRVNTQEGLLRLIASVEKARPSSRPAAKSDRPTLPEAALTPPATVRRRARKDTILLEGQVKSLAKLERAR